MLVIWSWAFGTFSTFGRYRFGKVVHIILSNSVLYQGFRFVELAIFTMHEKLSTKIFMHPSAILIIPTSSFYLDIDFTFINKLRNKKGAKISLLEVYELWLHFFYWFRSKILITLNWCPLWPSLPLSLRFFLNNIWLKSLNF